MTWNDLAEADRTHLARAVELGRLGWGRVEPNPMVGCVLVKDGSVLSEGFHESYGGPHAEARALASSGSADGATAYVSLEPCRHYGHTPPCTEALLRAGVARVVYWASEPGTEAGGGGRWLREQGVAVEGPVDGPSDWARENPFFFHQDREGLPYVALKLALSLDGGIAPETGTQQWLTGPEAQAEVHRIRAGFNAVMVGGGTWRTDDPQLTVRGSLVPREAPIRVVLDSHGELMPSARVFDDADAPVWIVTRNGNEGALEARLGSVATVVPVAPGPCGLDTRSLLVELRERGVQTVLCEGGGRLARSLLAADAVERLYLFRAPVLLGAHRVHGFPPGPWPSIEEGGSVHDGWTSAGPSRRFGPDILTILDRSE